MKVLVSACIMGCNCKYNGGNNSNQKVIDFLKDKEVIEICPELLAGMSVPRTPVEIVNGFIMDNTGKNLHKEYENGIKLAMEQIKDANIDLAILQSRSPTCGVNKIYDGSFQGILISGQGLFAKALIKSGYKVVDSEDIESFSELENLTEDGGF